MINYDNAIIYYITKNSTKHLYIGSTTNYNARKYVHKHRCYNKNSEYYDDALYSKIRKLGGWDNWEMGILIAYPCNNRNELQTYERKIINELNANLNSSLPTTNTKKYTKKSE